MADFLHAFESDHGPVFVFSSKSTRPYSSGRTIKIKEYLGHTDPSVARLVKNKVESKDLIKKDEEEFTRQVKNPEKVDKKAKLCSVSDYIRWMVL